MVLEVKPVSQAVMKRETSDMMTDLLKTAVERGTGKLAKLKDRPVAGKTGTTQLPQLPDFSKLKQGNKDAWFAGYTPELVGVVWLGYDITDPTHYLDKIYGGSFPAAIWNKVFSRILSNAPPSSFAPPPAAMVAAEKRLFDSKPKIPPEAASSSGQVHTVAEAVSSDSEQNASKDKLHLLDKLFSLFRKN